MKKLSILLCLLLALACISFINFNSSNIIANGLTSNSIEVIETTNEKSYCEATLEDDFAEDSIIVVLNKKVSHDFGKSHTIKDFPELKALRIENLTASTSEAIQEQSSTSLRNNFTKQSVMEIDVNNFRKILKIDLENSGKENILNAIRKIEQRLDVVSAEPNYYYYNTSVIPNDMFYSNQWAIGAINLQNAWEITTGSRRVRIF